MDFKLKYSKDSLEYKEYLILKLQIWFKKEKHK